MANQIDRATVRLTASYSFLPGFSAGIEYNPTAESVSPLLNLLLLPEGLRRPAVMLGTSSDRIGTPSGQSFFVTAAKSLKGEVRLPVAPYFGVAYGTYEDRLRWIGGVNVGFTEQFSSMLIFDGVKLHPTFSFAADRHHLTLLLIGGKDPGISYSVVF